MPRAVTNLVLALTLELAARALLAERVAQADEVVFDLPSVVECRDVTTTEFAAATPHLKQIEAKVRISARECDGAPVEILQLDYEIRTSGAVRVVDYGPRTTLESSIVLDQIDINATAENSQSLGAEAAILYKPGVLGGSRTTSAKKSEAKHFKQVAAKDVVLASGTLDREHGVFFRLRPSRTAAFEGSRDFTIVMAVPVGWRGDICRISCAARVARHSMMSTSAATIPGPQTPVGMYIAGDTEASAAAEQLQRIGDQYQQLVAEREGKSRLVDALSKSAGNIFARAEANRRRETTEDIAHSLKAVEERLKQLSDAAADSGNY